MRQILVTLLFTLLSCLILNAKEVVDVEGEFTYYGRGDESRDKCMRAALDGARTAALENRFGRSVSGKTFQREAMENGRETTTFINENHTLVRGEWIADRDEPQFSIATDKDGCYVITCTIKGKAREISNSAVRFDALPLRNGTTRGNSATRFDSGDQLYIWFKAPADGYASVYLIDTDGVVYTLLPYQNAPLMAKVTGGQEYVFFDPKSAPADHGVVDEVEFSTAAPFESNRIYVVYSPNEFSRANDSWTGGNLPRHMSYQEFSKWLSRSIDRDPALSWKIIDVEIAGK